MSENELPTQDHDVVVSEFWQWYRDSAEYSRPLFDSNLRSKDAEAVWFIATAAAERVLAHARAALSATHEEPGAAAGLPRDKETNDGD